MGTCNTTTNTPKTQDLQKKVTQMYLSGDSIDTIAESFNFDNCKITEILESSLSQYESERKFAGRLKESDRRVIEFFHNLGKSNYYIAKLLDCSGATVGNELKRCSKDESYSAQGAQEDYNSKNHKKRGPRKLESAKSFLDYFCQTFKIEKQSPEACFYKVQAGAVDDLDENDTVSFKTIYNYIKQDLLEVSYSDLPCAPKRKQKRNLDFPKKDGKHTSGKSIDERPIIPRDEDSNITEFGNWEMDCLLGKKGKDEPVILSLLEKKTHYTILFKLETHKYSEVLKSLERLKAFYGEYWEDVFKTITTDNGSEFLPLGVNDDFSSDVYFCHPGQPKEKPQVERMNSNLRKYYPKGCSLAEVSEDDLALVEEWVNSHYCLSLKKNCAQNLFDEEMDKICAA